MRRNVPLPARPTPARRLDWPALFHKNLPSNRSFVNAWHRVARLLIWTLTRLHAGALALTPRPRAERRHEAEVRAILHVVSARIFHAGEAAVRSEPAAPPGWIDVARPFAAFALPMSELSGPYE